MSRQIVFSILVWASFCVMPSMAAPTTVKLLAPTKNQQVQLAKLFEVLELEKSIDESFERLIRKVKFQVYQTFYAKFSKEKNTTREQASQKTHIKADRVIKKFRDSIEKEYKSESRKIYSHVYSKYYTAEDMKTLIAFYTSEAGKKAMDKSNIIVKRTLLKLARKVKPKAEALIEKKLSQMYSQSNTGNGDSVLDDIME